MIVDKMMLKVIASAMAQGINSYAEFGSFDLLNLASDRETTEI